MTAPDPQPTGDEEEGATVVGRVLTRGDRSARRWRRRIGAMLPAPVVNVWNGIGSAANRLLPKSLLGRSMLIIVLPMVILQAVLAYVFLERHWELVTSRLSNGVVRNIGAIIDVIEEQPPGASIARVSEVAATRLRLGVTIGPPEPLQPLEEVSVADTLVARTLAADLRSEIRRPFALEITDGRMIEIKVAIDRGTLIVRFDRNLAYAANWHIFLVWMVGTALFLTGFSILFIRNQIKPIQRLANAAQAFGKGRPVGHFVPQGAREVRKAAQAFIEMRRRIERQIEQRTTMLAGVSHDLRTVLTRFRLELALMPQNEETEAMRRDVDEMEAMLDAYVAFAKGDADEAAEPVDVAALIAGIAERPGRPEARVTTRFAGDPMVSVRPGAFRRLMGNLVGNAVRYARHVEVTGEHRDGWLTILVDDDGPGIPEAEREAVFRPFYRLDAARNQDEAGTGLGLAIARDVARSHGGDIRLDDAPLGGLRAVVRLPG